MSKVKLALVGAGDRGFHCYAPYVTENPWKAEFTAVAEKNPEKRKLFGDEFHIPESCRFEDWNELLNGQWRRAIIFYLKSRCLPH